MEGLIAIFAEVLAALIAPLVSAIGALIAAALTLLLELIACVLPTVARRFGRKLPPFPRAVRWIAASALVVTALLLSAGLIVQIFFAESVLRWAMDRQQARSGIAITWRSAQINLFTGHARFANLHLARLDHPTLAFDLTCTDADIDLAVLACVRGTAIVECAMIHGVRGELRQVLGSVVAVPHRTFRIDTLRVDDLELAVALSRSDSVTILRGPVRIEHFASETLTSNRLLFDVLFRSHANGSVFGAPISIDSGIADHGRWTQWRGTGVPVALMALYVGGPFSLFDAGQIDVDVQDTWNLEQPKYLHFDYRFAAHDLTVAPISELRGLGRMLAPALAEFVRRHDGALDLHATLDVDPDHFANALSLDARLLGRALMKPLGTALGLPPEELKTLSASLLKLGQGVLDHWRKR